MTVRGDRRNDGAGGRLMRALEAEITPMSEVISCLHFICFIACLYCRGRILETVIIESCRGACKAHSETKSSFVNIGLNVVCKEETGQ